MNFFLKKEQKPVVIFKQKNGFKKTKTGRLFLYLKKKNRFSKNPGFFSTLTIKVLDPRHII